MTETFELWHVSKRTKASHVMNFDTIEAAMIAVEKSTKYLDISELAMFATDDKGWTRFVGSGKALLDEPG